MIYPTTTLKTVATFRDSTGALFDPTTVTCTVTSPAGAATTYTYGSSSNLTKSSTGVYSCVYEAESYGTWYEKWYGEDSAGKITVETYQILSPTH